MTYLPQVSGSWHFPNQAVEMPRNLSSELDVKFTLSPQTDQRRELRSLEQIFPQLK